MNYTGCFNRSQNRAAFNLQPVFCSSGASVVAGVECCTRPPLRPPGASVVAGVECCARPPLRPPGASVVAGVECCTRLPLRPSLAPTSSHYTHYSKSQILEFLQCAHSRQLVIDLIEHYRY